MLKAPPVTKMMLLVAVSKESQITFHKARNQIGYAMRETLEQRARMLPILTKLSGATEIESFRNNVLPNIRIHLALGTALMSGYPIPEMFHEMFSLRLVDSDTGLPARLSSQLSLCIIILNETISRAKATDRSRYLAYSAMRTNDKVTIAFYQQAERRTMMEPWKRLAPAHVFFKLLSRYWAPDILLFLNQVYSKCATEFILEQASYDGSTVILGEYDDSNSKEDDAAYCDFEFAGFETKAKKKKDSDFDSEDCRGR